MSASAEVPTASLPKREGLSLHLEMYSNVFSLCEVADLIGNRQVHEYFFIQPLGGVDSLNRPMNTKGKILMVGLLSRDHLSYSDII